MKTKNAVLIYSIVILFWLNSCRKFVQAGLPKTNLIAKSVFTSDATATAAQLFIYNQMALNASYDFTLYPGLSADEFTNFNSDPAVSQFYTNSLISSNLSVAAIWAEAYKYIYSTNAVLEGLNSTFGISPLVRRQLTGEAKFVRAFWHFYLVNLFGEIPYVKTSDYKVNSTAKRLAIEDVYKDIVSDLLEARDSLNNNFLASNSSTVTAERVRPTKWAASALLARVYLYTKQWKNAESESSLIIANSSVFKLQDNLASVFSMNNPEAIWQLQTSNLTGFNTAEGSNFILTYPPYNVSLNKTFVNSFDSNDLRKTEWISEYVDGMDTFYFPYKYKVQYSSVITEYTMVLRVAEQYLIRAEARIQQGDASGIDDLNIIRNRAGLDNYAGLNDIPSVLSAITRERRFELFAEWGHRWLDVKRLYLTDSLMPDITLSKGGQWKAFQNLYPIPKSERDNDPNLSQNQGY